jgi:hypothetical protein
MGNKEAAPQTSTEAKANSPVRLSECFAVAILKDQPQSSGQCIWTSRARQPVPLWELVEY